MIIDINLIFLYFIIIIILFGFIYYTSYFYLRIFSIDELKLEQIDIMDQIEKTYGKKYPIGNDFFKIIHYPKYKSFFEQFNDYKYLVKKNKKQIISTCCFVNIYNDIYYICDLKKIGLEKNQAFDFVTYGYIILGIRKIFGIVMQHNPVINNLVYKYNLTKLEQLFLYKIKFYQIKKNMYIFNKIFPYFFITVGFKKFILESMFLTMEEQKIYLEQKLNEWQGDIEQVDDVLVMGVRIV
jgi:hypothetical protein